MSEKEDLRKFLLFLMSVNIMVSIAILSMWSVLKESGFEGLIAVPISLWVFIMTMTLLGIYLIEKDEKLKEKVNKDG